jgi:hypothetical protein
MTWTPERTATAIRMWGEGKSASAIARDLGGVTRNAVVGLLHRKGIYRGETTEGQPAAKSSPKPKRRVKAICPVQGCGKVLGKSNASGVCTDHTHVAPHCQCPKCRGEAATRRAAPINRTHVRTALVAPTGNVTSGGDAHIRVSLPREPWLPA